MSYNCYVYSEGLAEVRTIDEGEENVNACLGKGKQKHGMGVSFPATLQTPGIVRVLFLSNLQHLFQ